MSRVKNRSYRKKIFLYFFFTAVAPLLILGIYSYKSAKDAVRNNVYQVNAAALAQVENRVDNVLDAIQRNFFRLATSSLTSQIIDQEMDEIRYTVLRDYTADIGQNQAYLGYMNGYALVNFKKGWVLSNKGMFSIDEITNPEEIDGICRRKDKVFWTNSGAADSEKELSREHVDNGYLTFVTKIPIYSEGVDGAFLVNIDQHGFEQLLSQSLGNGSLTVFDKEGRLVFSENDTIADYYQTQPKQLEAMAGGQAFNVRLGNETYDLVVRRSPVTSWTYIAGYNPAVINRALTPILVTMGGIITVILMAITALSLLGSEKVSRPVKELVSNFEGLVERKEDDDEFGLINQGIRQLVGHNEQLQAMIDRQKNQLMELLGLRLIRGSLGKEEILQTRERLGILDGPVYCVVSAVFCQKAEKRSGFGMEQDVLNLELMKSMPEEIRQILALPPFIYTKATVMILESRDEAKMEQKILALRNCLSVYGAKTFGGYVDMGVSRQFQELTGFKRGYQESLEALKINEYYGHEEEEGVLTLEDSSITYYGDLIRKNSGGAEYDLAVDSAVREAVDNCDRAAAFRAVDQFMQGVSQSGAVMYEQHYYLYRFLMTILSVPADAGIPVGNLFPEGEANLFTQFNLLYDYNSIREFYEEKIIVPVIQHLEQFKKSRSQVLLENIIELIHSRGGDITLAECAEELGYHPSYIWRVMKNTGDVTFTDYLASQKIQMAKELLTQTDCSVAEIAEKLNYSNAQNFIRVFKKHMGVTPGQYRKNPGGLEG